MKRASLLLVGVLALVCAPRFPAPIVEIPASPAPSSQQTIKPKSKRLVKPRASKTEESSTRSQQSFTALKNAPATQITATATSQHPGNEATNAVDGNTKTIWHTPWGLFGPETSLPQPIILI
jgi:hypothetical protein